MDYFVVRDPQTPGDVATVWNFKRQAWCWDLEGDYTKQDGFAYLNPKTAERRAMVCREVFGRKYAGIRVLDRAELEDFRNLA